MRLRVGSRMAKMTEAQVHNSYTSYVRTKRRRLVRNPYHRLEHHLSDVVSLCPIT